MRVHLNATRKAGKIRPYGTKCVGDESSRGPSRRDDDVDQGLWPMTAHARLIAADRRAMQQEEAKGPALLLYSLVSGLVALGVGAVASFAASSEEGKLVLWSVVTGITAVTAGAAHESRWVRGLPRSVVHWILSA